MDGPPVGVAGVPPAAGEIAPRRGKVVAARAVPAVPDAPRGIGPAGSRDGTLALVFVPAPARRVVPARVQVGVRLGVRRVRVRAQRGVLAPVRRRRGCRARVGGEPAARARAATRIIVRPPRARREQRALLRLGSRVRGLRRLGPAPRRGRVRGRRARGAFGGVFLRARDETGSGRDEDEDENENGDETGQKTVRFRFASRHTRASLENDAFRHTRAFAVRGSRFAVRSSRGRENGDATRIHLDDAKRKERLSRSRDGTHSDRGSRSFAPSYLLHARQVHGFRHRELTCGSHRAAFRLRCGDGRVTRGQRACGDKTYAEISIGIVGGSRNERRRVVREQTSP